MILKASQRAGAKQLALHLLNSKDNEHVDVHELRGFLSDDLAGALKEAQATASGSRCKQFLFSVSLNPPENQTVTTDQFEKAIQKIEERNGLQGQPRAIVFHEKEGRRHAHVVWSRIDARSMTARNLPHFKLKLQDISRQLYIEHGWKMPSGLMKHGPRDPRNFTLAEWQQAKRIGLHAGDIKEMFQDCWAASDNRAAFAQALSERGFILARGDRRDFVAVSFNGEVVSLRSQTGKRVKALRAKLGDASDLPSVNDAKAQIRGEMGRMFRRHIEETRSTLTSRTAWLERSRRDMTKTHRQERVQQAAGQKQRWSLETSVRAARLRSGLGGIWQFVTGVRSRVTQENERAALEAYQRDRDEKDTLITVQLAERQALQAKIASERQRTAQILLKIRKDRQHVREATAPNEIEVMKQRFDDKQRNKRGNRPKRRSSSRRRTPRRPTPEP